MGPSRPSVPTPCAFEDALLFAPVLLDLPSSDWRRRLSLKNGQPRPKRVVFVGTGSSFHVAWWAAHLYRSHGVAAESVKTFDALSGVGPAWAKGDLAVIISHRGARGLTRALIKKLSAGDGPRLFLVCGEGSPTAGLDHVFSSPPEEAQAHSQSLIGAMAALATLLEILKPSQALDIEGARRITARHLAKIMQDPLASLPLPPRGAHLHFVGWGPFEAVAHEMRLKAMEVAHMPALSHHTEEFLHGPVASLEPGDEVILMEPSPVGLKGAAGKLVSRRHKACERAALTIGARISKPKLPGALSLAWQATLALAHGQRLCLNMARAKSINPDRNRQENPRYQRAFEHCKFK